MTEQTIAKFKYINSTIKLLEITEEEIGIDGMPTDLNKIYYLITRNRKRIARILWKETALKKFASIIAGELLQTKLTL